MYRSHLSRLSSTELRLLTDFVSESLNEGWSKQRRTIELLLYLSGEKPATEFTQVYKSESFTTVRNIQPNGFARLVEEFDLPHACISRDLTDELVAVYYECLPDSETPLPPLIGEGTQFHRDWGEHYGYPREAINAFIDGSCIRYSSNPQDKQKLTELAGEAGIGDRQLRRLPLISFLPPSTVDGVKTAVETALNHETVLQDIADAYEMPQVRELIDSIVENQPRPES